MQFNLLFLTYFPLTKKSELSKYFYLKRLDNIIKGILLQRITKLLVYIPLYYFIHSFQNNKKNKNFKTFDGSSKMNLEKESHNFYFFFTLT